MLEGDGASPSPFLILPRNETVTRAWHGRAIRPEGVKAMFYRSERLFLRPAFPEDARELYHAICDARVVAMLASAPWPYRLADAEDFCARPADPRAPRFLVT